jgi:hypothetical protein
LPFLTSRSSALRTKRSRCPAASGPCSPRGSVSRIPGPEGPGGIDALLGFSPLQSVSPQTVEPASRLLPSCASAARSPKRPNDRHFKALPSLRVAPALADRRDSLEVLHQDLPSGSPDDSGVLSNEIREDLEYTLRSLPRSEDRRPPEGGPGSTPKSAPGGSRPRRPGKFPPRGASLLHHLVKENRRRVGPCGARLPGSLPRPPWGIIYITKGASRAYFLHKSLFHSMLGNCGYLVDA